MRVGGSSGGTVAQEKSAKKIGKVLPSARSIVEVDLVDGHNWTGPVAEHAVVVDDDLSWSGERFVLVRFADGHQRYLRESEVSLVEERPSMP